jgi:iron complex outermembrane receptor protein
MNAFRFKEFIEDTADYSNQLTGVPESQFNFGLDLTAKNGFSLKTSFEPWAGFH